jgi:regulation of enolase protein 1 (concanavalin A-like superfamily)
MTGKMHSRRSGIRMAIRMPIQMAILGTAGMIAQGHAQTSACSDSFAVANVGAGKTWQVLALDKSTDGTATVADGQLILAGRGADIYGARNEFVAAYRGDIEGDFDVSVKLVSQDSVHEWSQAGIVVANDLADLTKGGYAAVDISPANGYTVFYDKTAPAGQLDGNSGAGKTVYPAWLRFSKAGTQYTAWYKTQASGTWNQLPKPPVSLNTAAKVQIGLFTVSHNTAKTGKAVFDDFTCLHVQATPVFAPHARRLGFSKQERNPAKGVNALGKAWPAKSGGRARPIGLTGESPR